MILLLIFSYNQTFIYVTIILHPLTGYFNYWWNTTQNKQKN